MSLPPPPLSVTALLVAMMMSSPLVPVNVVADVALLMTVAVAELLLAMPSDGGVGERTAQRRIIDEECIDESRRGASAPESKTVDEEMVDRIRIGIVRRQHPRLNID